MPDDFNEQEAKARLMQVLPAVVGTHHIEALLADPKDGIVTWDALARDGMPEFEHWLSFPKAIHTALAFCGTDTRHEWVVLGRSALVIMRSNPDFEQCEPIECGMLIYIGKHKTISVYTQSVDTNRPLLGNEFVAGIRGHAARGCIVHGPCPQQVIPQDEPLNFDEDVEAPPRPRHHRLRLKEEEE